MRWNQPAKFIFNKTNGSYPQIVRLQKLIDTNLDSMISKYKRTPLTPFHILLQKMQYHYLANLNCFSYVPSVLFFYASLPFIFLLSPFSSLHFFVGFVVGDSFLYFIYCGHYCIIDFSGWLWFQIEGWHKVDSVSFHLSLR